MRYIQGENRSQSALFPLSLDELIPDDHLVQVPNPMAVGRCWSAHTPAGSHQLVGTLNRGRRRRFTVMARTTNASAITLKNSVLNHGNGSYRVLVASISVILGNTDRI